MGVRRYVRLTAGIAAVAVLGVGAAATAHGNKRGFSERLSGFQEVPALSSSGFGTFRAHVDRRDGEIDWRLSFDNLESAVTQAHIHFENATNNGPIVVFLCSNLGERSGRHAGVPGRRRDHPGHDHGRRDRRRRRRPGARGGQLRRVRPRSALGSDVRQRPQRRPPGRGDPRADQRLTSRRPARGNATPAHPGAGVATPCYSRGPVHLGAERLSSASGRGASRICDRPRPDRGAEPIAGARRGCDGRAQPDAS